MKIEENAKKKRPTGQIFKRLTIASERLKIALNGQQIPCLYLLAMIIETNNSAEKGARIKSKKKVAGKLPKNSRR